MFYLLENNRIIDSENLPKDAKIERIEKDDKGNAFFIQIQYSDFLKTRKIGYIKKQSESVFGLIEKGDLLKYKSYYGICIEEVIDIITKYMVIETATDQVYEEGFLAIYKPDEEGNYIKVWEKKEDEKED